MLLAPPPKTDASGVGFMVYVAHRRAGKTTAIVLAMAKLIDELLQEKEIFKLRKDVDSYNPRVAFSAKTQKQAREIVWNDARQVLC